MLKLLGVKSHHFVEMYGILSIQKGSLQKQRQVYL